MRENALTLGRKVTQMATKEALKMCPLKKRLNAPFYKYKTLVYNLQDDLA